MVVAFFGHSKYFAESGDEERLVSLLEEITRGQRVDFYLGGYGAFDAFARKCAQIYKEKHLNARLFLVVPYLDGRLEGENRYDEILYPALERVPKKYAIIKRNEWMVRQADYVVAYVKTHYGGAYKALFYAHKNNKPYKNMYQGEYKLY